MIATNKSKTSLQVTIIVPDSAELEEIKKLPNFDEAVMRELILGKESKK